MSLRLTQTVKKGGCAAKVAATELREILKRVHFPPKREDILIDGSQFDDAAVIRISENLALVETIDFFTPIVDSPRVFGRISAANALSDIYAMGGIPKSALAVLAFPLSEMSHEVIAEILNGALDTLNQADASLVGGHSIDDETLKFGLSVSGFVDPQLIWSNQGARPSDLLILTKPLGTGTLTAGLKRGTYTESDIQEALDSMSLINRVPQILNEEERSLIHAATDITGFGLSGHLTQVARASLVEMQIETSSLPLFPQVLDSLKSEHLTKAHRTNREYTQNFLSPPSSKLFELLTYDPQTSGGLLLSVKAEAASDLLKKIQTSFPHAQIIGEVTQRNAEGFVRFN